MPRTAPVDPRPAADAERRVHALLLAQLGADDVLLAGPATTVDGATVGTGLLVGLAGAGVVADSDPDLEDLETRNKASAVLQAIATAETLRAVR